KPLITSAFCSRVAKKGFSYINADWSSQPMWITNPVFQKVDARLQVNQYISERWKSEMEKARYLHANDVSELFPE
ncbi:MAG: hypothetical protein AAFQ20_05145, partial [Bacteroidota bacterium]